MATKRKQKTNSDIYREFYGNARKKQSELEKFKQCNSEYAAVIKQLEKDKDSLLVELNEKNRRLTLYDLKFEKVRNFIRAIDDLTNLRVKIKAADELAAVHFDKLREENI